MRDTFLPFHKASIGEQEINEVIDSLKSGWITTGPKTKRFEEKFSARVGAKYAVAVNSCTAAMHLALAAIGIQEGDEVIVPVMTFTATAEVVAYFKAVPVFVDCNPDTLLIDIADLEKKITPKTRAIMPVHYAGQACDIDEIAAIAKKHGLKVIWDAAHSFPTVYKGKNVGSFPDIVCFSFYATKTLATGEGGMAVTDNKEFADKMRILSLHGMNRDAWNRYSKEGSWYYEIVAPGYKYNLTDIASSLGLVQLERADELLEKRKSIAQRYSEAFKEFRGISMLAKMPYGESSWHLFVIKLDLEMLSIGRGQFIEELKIRNIGSSVHFIPLHLHPYWKEIYSFKESDFPAAAAVYQQIVSLPIFPDMSENDITNVIDAVADIIGKNQ
ncbi:MAG TPA: DegT/DnrJ/EryC1/StrS family aminotransferase [Candidatus Paceibacterota bacterium]|nr:DegT/DnrJ/EryC1/StrS family aminotransferase [Candidatus Pacearchaeota archaeon]HRZ50670.1 DegT/DnrJ/EryC1/StrS family aminotransferase [Candidatus Paceibacterota bacterium]HSA36433.1 DegT/DnrJ/EryC1/StrS family aminotransferase [Candidatus Paceibacterota bacterium]